MLVQVLEVKQKLNSEHLSGQIQERGIISFKIQTRT